MNTMTTSTQLRRLIATAILGALASGFAGVSAADDSGVRSKTVKYGDLNLSNPQGAAALYGRIVQAAYAVCDTADIGLWSRTAVHDCISKAVTDAVTKVGRPTFVTASVTALLMRSAGHTPALKPSFDPACRLLLETKHSS